MTSRATQATILWPHREEKDGLENETMLDMIGGRWRRGRPRARWMDWVKQMMQ